MERVQLLRLPRASRGSRAALAPAAEPELSDGNEVRLVYSDDPRLRGSGLLGRWLERTELEQAHERAIVRAAAEAAAEIPTSTGGPTAAGDTRKLRGIPAIGRGVAGAMKDTDPERALLRRQPDAQGFDDSSR